MEKSKRIRKQKAEDEKVYKYIQIPLKKSEYNIFKKKMNESIYNSESMFFRAQLLSTLKKFEQTELL